VRTGFTRKSVNAKFHEKITAEGEEEAGAYR
jgi:hypothetical protein